MAPSPVGCQALPCAEAAGCWLAWPGHTVGDCRTPGCLRAYASSLMGRVRAQKTLGLLSTHCWVKPGPGVSAGLLAGKARSWSLAAGPWDPRAGVRSLVAERFLTQLVTVSRESQSFCWPAVGRLGPQAAGLWFSCTWVCPLVGEAGLEASSGFLEARAGACPLVDVAGSWPSLGQGHV